MVSDDSKKNKRDEVFFKCVLFYIDLNRFQIFTSRYGAKT